MTPLIRKELWLLMPAWVTAILTATLPLWISQFYLAFIPTCFTASALFVGLAPFGQEMTYGTFSLLLAQPEQRRRLWNIKARLTGMALFSSWVIVILSVMHRSGEPGEAYYGSSLARQCAIYSLITIVAYTGGLWTTLLLRELVTAFLVSVLVPGAIVIGVMLKLAFSNSKDLDNILPTSLVWLLSLYSIVGFWFGRRLFFQAQDVAWTGGEVSLPAGLRWRMRVFPTGFTQKYGPRLAFARKELGKHTTALFMVPWLAAGHLAAIVARHYVSPHGDIRSCLDTAWIFWLVVPVLAGTVAVAQERRLNTHQGQFGLPFSTANQFVIKFGVALALGIGLGGGIPCLLEYGASAAGLHSEFGATEFILGNTTVIVLAAFYASTLTDGLLPAFLATLCLGLGILATFSLFPNQGSWRSYGPFAATDEALYIGMAWPATAAVFLALVYRNSKAIRAGRRPLLGNLSVAVLFFASAAALCLTAFGRAGGFGSLLYFSVGYLSFIYPAFALYHQTIFICIAWPVMSVTFLWLAYKNSTAIRTGMRLWLDNLNVAAAVFASVVALSSAIYDRSWELILPLEPRHGAAAITGRGPATVVVYSGIAALLPDGRLWNGRYITTGRFSRQKLSGAFVPGTNWAYLSGGFQCLAIKSDGTLWKVKDDGGISQIGSDSDWKKVVNVDSWFLALKNNGSLWWLRASTEPDAGDSSKPPVHLFYIGSDWADIFTSGFENQAELVIVNKNGEFWSLQVVHQYGTRDAPQFRRVWIDMGLEGTNWTSLVNASGQSYPNSVLVGLRDNGTLWKFGGKFDLADGRDGVRMGNRSDWMQLSASGVHIVALESTGTLSEIAGGSTGSRWIRPDPDYPQMQPSKYSDWIGVGADPDGTWTLAADGTLCYWQDNIIQRLSGPLPYRRPFLRPPRRPIIAINILHPN